MPLRMSRHGGAINDLNSSSLIDIKTVSGFHIADSAQGVSSNEFL